MNIKKELKRKTILLGNGVNIAIQEPTLKDMCVATQTIYPREKITREHIDILVDLLILTAYEPVQNSKLKIFDFEDRENIKRSPQLVPALKHIAESCRVFNESRFLNR